MTLKYKLKFYDYWHLSSGLSAGAKLDSIVTKDRDAIPYAPGKTIKGLVREMAELSNDEDFIKRCFGDEGVDMGECYFTNATLENREEIVANKLQNKLYATLASTKISDNGIAEDDSLREIEVVIPLTLSGEILDVAKEDYQKIVNALTLIKRVGLNRNRGLGRCQFRVVEQNNG